MKFFGRVKELDQLRKELSADDMRMCLIYGRRRVGKSELVKQVINEIDAKTLYYECKQVTEESNVQSICDVVSEVLGLPKLGYTKLEEIVDYIFSLSLNENLVFVLDEYPYLRENVRGLDRILQSLVDKYRDETRLKLVILGSYVDIMKSLFRYSSQLKIMDPETFYDKYINIDFEEAYVPHKFEEIARQYLIRQNRLGNIEPVIEKIGKYYYDDPKTRTNGEFDVVTWDEKGYVFYEVKFRKKKTSKEVIEEEIRQVNATGLHCYKYVFFSRSGFTEKETDEIKQIELRELFSKGYR